MNDACCNNRKTPFCPTCGSKTSSNPTLDGLLAHCKASVGPMIKQMQRLEATTSNWPRDASGAVMDAKRFDRIVASEARLSVRIAKWKAWILALEAVLDGNDHTPEGG
jgi:hypothetical protein